MTRRALRSGAKRRPLLCAAGQVHPRRIGIRRLHTAVRFFEPWLPAEPALPMPPLRELFSQLCLASGGDVLESGVEAALR